EPSQFTLTIKPAKLPRKFLHAAMIALALLLVVAAYQIMPSSPKQTQKQALALPNAKDLDALEAENDRQLIEKDRVRQQGMQEMSKKLEEMSKAKETEAAKKQQELNQQRGEFE